MFDGQYVKARIVPNQDSRERRSFGGTCKQDDGI
jgi:hypothetical protein